MTEYQKIETLYKFDNATKTYRKELFNPYVDYLKDNEWIASEKIDGTNVQVEYDGHRVAFHGRTERTNFPKEVFAALTEKFADSEVVFEQINELLKENECCRKLKLKSKCQKTGASIV